MEDRKYFSHAWELLTRDKGWIKPLLVMTAATLVPVAGPLGNKGYALEWARLTAWGVDAAPKQKNVQVGACIASGWRGFVVELGWGVAYGLAISLLNLVASVLPGVLGTLVGGILSLATMVISAFVGVVLMVAQIRAAIYERIGAGYRADRITEMIKADSQGFLRVVLVNLACTCAAALAGGIMGGVLAVELSPVIIAALAEDDAAVLMALAGSLGAIVVTAALFGLVLCFVGILVRLLLANTTALWMRQFDVPSWGRSEDPLPATPQSVPTWEDIEVKVPEETSSWDEIGATADPEPEPKSVDELYDDLQRLIDTNEHDE